MIAAIRSGFLYFVMAGLGAWSVWAQFFYRAPQPFLTVLLAVLTLAATGLTLAVGLAKIYRATVIRTKPRRLVELGHRACALVIVGFTGWGLFLFGNGKLDWSEPVPHASQIVGIAADETGLGATIPITWMVLRPWQDPKRPQRLLLRWDERSRLFGGQPVVVLVRRGFFGFRWVSAIEPDFQRQSREILDIVPQAAEVWKELARFNVRIGRYDEARRAASEYAARFPDDPDFPVQVAGILARRGDFPGVVVLLTPVAANRQHAGASMYLGYALGMQGRPAEGVAQLERARDLEPDNWWPHYALGRVQAAHGDTAAAVRSFERALELRPGLADVQRELARLRPLVARQRS